MAPYRRMPTLTSAKTCRKSHRGKMVRCVARQRRRAALLAQVDRLFVVRDCNFVVAAPANTIAHNNMRIGIFHAFSAAEARLLCHTSPASQLRSRSPSPKSSLNLTAKAVTSSTTTSAVAPCRCGARLYLEFPSMDSSTMRCAARACREANPNRMHSALQAVGGREQGFNTLHRISC